MCKFKRFATLEPHVGGGALPAQRFDPAVTIHQVRLRHVGHIAGRLSNGESPMCLGQASAALGVLLALAAVLPIDGQGSPGARLAAVPAC